ncbi:MarR family winged helix-turn-helix transcriptional regulator [Acidovorax sp. Leaf78]|uniref:MarR family winged helix-turn-helix transcriptional regulator n=1 Tax=unclassified Acidovorax TaxID=2684926 RepID=UPI0006F2F053|nr:MarR family winged helix-turn-helix transcriptional regulator [Acidovorax sp. Leaf78]KQO16830.1 MarR family transcriptional regulator [Acidovorax sp. Leaf78]
MAESTPPSTPQHTSSPRVDDGWRQTHLGRLLGHAMRRFDARVLQLMARNVEVPLALSNLAARDQVTAAHVHITRHLALSGDRLTDLAQRAGMTKQAMANLVDQCEAWGLVTRQADPLDARARRVCFTATGLAWVQAFRDAVAQAEAEFRAEVGNDVATVVAIGLEAYASGDAEWLGAGRRE